MTAVDGTGGGIVSMEGYRRDTSYDPITEVEAYWEALRGTRTVPLRSEIDPRGIERALDFTFLLERIAPGLARFRLAGKRLNDLMGMEVRGMPLTACLTPSAREEIREALNLLFEGPRVVTARLAGESGLGRPKLAGSIILLPLKSDLGDISRAIGCMNIQGRIGRTPRRFDVASVAYREIGAYRTKQPEHDGARVENPQVPGFAEPKPEFRVKGGQMGAHLRLVKTDTGGN